MIPLQPNDGCDSLPSLVRTQFAAQLRALDADISVCQDKESVIRTARQTCALIDRIIQAELAFQSEPHSDANRNSVSERPSTQPRRRRPKRPSDRRSESDPTH